MHKIVDTVPSRFLIAGLLAITACSLLAGQQIGGEPADPCQQTERSYRGELIKQFQILGQQGFANTEKVSAMLQSDPVLENCRKVLNATSPRGPDIRLQLDTLDSHLLYLSRNLAMPNAQRFADADECRALGFDPTKKGDVAIARQAVEAIWPYPTRMDGTPLPPNR